MVRSLALQGSIDCVEPQAAFSFLFGDDQFMRIYHKEVNEDPDAEVSIWTADGRRTVVFGAPLDAPAVVRKFVGTNVLRIQEVQEYERVGNTFTVRSDPVVEGTAGEIFSTKGDIVLEPSKNGKGCAVTMNVALECKTSVWGVKGTMESFMEMKARKSFEEWIRMACEFCKVQLAQAGEAFLSFQTNEDATFSSENDNYFDTEEVADWDTSLPIHSNTLVEQICGNNPVDGHPLGVVKLLEPQATSRCDSDLWLMQSVLRELNGLRISSEASRAHLEKLNAKLQRLEGDIGCVRCHMQMKKREESLMSPRAAWTLVGLGVTTALLFGVGHAYLKSQR